jgi:hypothetical protein
LYLPSAYEQSDVSRAPSSYTRRANHLDFAPGAPLYVSPDVGTRFGRAPSRDSRRKSHLPPVLDSNRLVRQRGGGPTPLQSDSRSFVDIDDDVAMSVWSTAPNTSGSTASAGHSHAHTPQIDSFSAWAQGASKHAYRTSPGRDSHRSRRPKGNSIVVTLEDEQSGKTVDVDSPSKKSLNPPLNLSVPRHGHRIRPLTAQTSTPTSIRPVLVTQNHPSSYVSLHDIPKLSTFDRGSAAAALVVQSPTIHHPSYSSDKENRNPSQPWLPTSSSQTNIAPTPNMFAHKMSSRKHDAHVKNTSSIFPNLPDYDQNKPQSALMRVNSAHSPSVLGSIKSRKEGMASETLKSPGYEVRHDQSLLPTLDNKSTDTRKPDTKNSHRDSPFVTRAQPVEIIDVDAIDPRISHATEKLPYFRPSHKSGMSSIDSTVRLERTLYSALGEELGSFGHQMDTTDMGPELAQALTGTMVSAEHTDRSSTSSAETDSDGVAKRKRQGTLGGERGRSPTNKKEKSKQAEVEDEGVF